MVQKAGEMVGIHLKPHDLHPEILGKNQRYWGFEMDWQPLWLKWNRGNDFSTCPGQDIIWVS
jgi:hypothetical protein